MKKHGSMHKRQSKQEQTNFPKLTFDTNCQLNSQTVDKKLLNEILKFKYLHLTI